MKILKLIFSILFILCYINAFETLSDAQKYAQRYPENITAENDDLSDPVYASWHFYLKQKHFVNYLLGERALWSFSMFIDLLRSVSLDRQINGYYGDFSIKFSPSPNTFFIVFGNIHGAFHSLIRCLTFLQVRGFIDNNFRISTPDVNIIFTGDIVNGSPYILETFTIILQLLKRNIHKVIYIKGKDETKSYWINNGLKRELRTRSNNIYDYVELKKEVNNFFNTLPWAFYITGNNPTEGIIRVSHFGLDFPEIKEAYCANTLKSLKFHSFQICNLNNKIEANGTPPLKALIKGQVSIKEYKVKKGLYTLIPQQSATTWKVFSAPTLLYQNYFNFYYDAFTVVQTGQEIQEAKMSLFNRDIREAVWFSKYRSYNLLFTRILDMPDNFFRDVSDDKDFTQKDISEIQNTLIEMQHKIEKISQEIFSLKNLLNDFVFSSEVESLPLK